MNSLNDYQTLALGEWETKVEERLWLWKEQDFSRRLWSKDPTLWFPQPQPEITDRLGWLALPEEMLDNLEMLSSFSEEIKDEGISDVVLFGMGGSSLAPDVFPRPTAIRPSTVGNSAWSPFIEAVVAKSLTIPAFSEACSRMRAVSDPSAYSPRNCMRRYPMFPPPHPTV